MITVVRAAPLLTVQDRGRLGYLAAGVTRSGALDALALRVANLLVGNTDDAAGLEGCLGGAIFRFEHDTVFVLAGAQVAATLDGFPVESYVTQRASAGGELVIERIVRGAAWYIGVHGGIDVPLVLESRSTLVSAGLGGAGGGPVKAGTQLQVMAAPASDTVRHAGDRPSARRSAVPDSLRSTLDDAPIPLCPGPRSDALHDAEWEAFYGGSFTVSHAVSRVGYRLQGPVLPARLPADLASEPACAGAMQLPPEGQPIVLMADFPTIGGYPVIGVVPGHALGRLAQCAPGTSVRFAQSTIDEAIDAQKREQNTLSKWASGG